MPSKSPRQPNVPAGFEVVELGTVASSNDEAKRLAIAGAKDGTVVWAAAQSDGRGRHSRNWSSPAGNLYLSIVLRPACAPSAALQLGFAGALAVCDAVRQFVPRGTHVALKWPNDVLIEGAKVSGMLLESSMQGGQGALEWAVMGVGLNLRSHPDDTPYPATDLAAAGARPSVTEALEAVLSHFSAWRRRWQGKGFGPIRAAWLQRAHRLNEELTVRREGGTTQTGIFAGVDDTGALLLDTAGGRRVLVHLGDVFPPSG